MLSDARALHPGIIRAVGCRPSEKHDPESQQVTAHSCFTMSPMKTIGATLMILTLASCQRSTTTTSTTATTSTSATATTKEKTTAEEAFEAGQRERKKAESIKNEQEKKAQQAIDDTNQ
jgi:hypothetical protein